MATITQQDHTWIQRWVKNQPTIYADIKTWGLTRSVYHAALQAVEDYMVSAFSNVPTATLRATIQAVTGATTVARATDVFLIWAAWRIRRQTGGG